MKGNIFICALLSIGLLSSSTQVHAGFFSRMKNKVSRKKSRSTTSKKSGFFSRMKGKFSRKKRSSSSTKKKKGFFSRMKSGFKKVGSKISSGFKALKAKLFKSSLKKTKLLRDKVKKDRIAQFNARSARSGYTFTDAKGAKKAVKTIKVVIKNSSKISRKAKANLTKLQAKARDNRARGKKSGVTQKDIAKMNSQVNWILTTLSQVTQTAIKALPYAFHAMYVHSPQQDKLNQLKQTVQEMSSPGDMEHKKRPRVETFEKVIKGLLTSLNKHQKSLQKFSQKGIADFELLFIKGTRNNKLNIYRTTVEAFNPLFRRAQVELARWNIFAIRHCYTNNAYKLHVYLNKQENAMRKAHDQANNATSMEAGDHDEGFMKKIVKTITKALKKVKALITRFEKVSEETIDAKIALPKKMIPYGDKRSSNAVYQQWQSRVSDLRQKFQTLVAPLQKQAAILEQQLEERKDNPGGNGSFSDDQFSEASNQYDAGMNEVDAYAHGNADETQDDYVAYDKQDGFDDEYAAQSDDSSVDGYGSGQGGMTHDDDASYNEGNDMHPDSAQVDEHAYGDENDMPSDMTHEDEHYDSGHGMSEHNEDASYNDDMHMADESAQMHDDSDHDTSMMDDSSHDDHDSSTDNHFTSYGDDNDDAHSDMSDSHDDEDGFDTSSEKQTSYPGGGWNKIRALSAFGGSRSSAAAA